MFVDLIFPKDNEKEFLKPAEQLGYHGLCFVYPDGEYKKKVEEIIQLQKKTNLKLYSALLTFSQKIFKESKLILVKSSTNDREVLEIGKVDIK